jgi:predicted secreted protein
MSSPIRRQARRVAVLCLFWGAVASPSLADQPLTYDRVSFAVTSERQVQTDEVAAVLAAQRQGAKAAELAREVNGLVTWGLKQAKEVPKVQVQTLAYETVPVYLKGSLSGWRVTQSIRLRARDAAVISELIGRLQERLLLQSVDYVVSDDRRKAAEADLIGRTLDAFKARARLIAERMGQPHYRMVEMHVNTGGQPPTPLFRSAPVGRAAAAEASTPVPPSIGAGMQTLRVGISGVIELQAQ